MTRASFIDGVPFKLDRSASAPDLREWARKTVPAVIEPFLERSCSLAGAMDYLERYSSRLPLYMWSKPMLLALMGDTEGLHGFMETPHPGLSFTPEPVYYAAFLATVAAYATAKKRALHDPR